VADVTVLMIDFQEALALAPGFSNRVPQHKRGFLIMKTVRINKLDTTNLNKLMRCFDPKRIQAEEATPEAIETCRLMGVELLLSPSASPHVERAIVDIGYAGKGVVDLSGLKIASPEEAEKILSNAGIRIFAAEDRGGISVEDLPRVLAAVSAAAVPSENQEGDVISDTNKKLLASGYIPGQNYEQCLEMAKWHPGMAEVMKDIPDGQTFGLVKMAFARATACACESSPNEGLLRHGVVLGKTTDAMKDRLMLFAADLHKVFIQIAPLLAAIEHSPCTLLAVNREMHDLLSKHAGSERYLGNLHII
jgi:hypothetical protein